MRKFACTVAVLFVLALIAAPASKAGSLTLTLDNVTPSATAFTISGTYASNVPTTSFSAPNQAYSMTFNLLTNPSTLSSFTPDTVDGLFLVNADFNFTFGGSTMNLGAITVEFDTLGGGNLGGMIFCLDNGGTSCPSNTDWNIFGTQLFGGSVSNPTFINAPKGVFVSNQSQYVINGFGPFNFGGSPTPEPAPMLLLGTGLLGIGYLTRRKLRHR